MIINTDTTFSDQKAQPAAGLRLLGWRLRKALEDYPVYRLLSTTLTLALTLSLLLAATSAFAHTPLCSCFDNGDGTVLCEGGFSDGSSASGVMMEVKDASGNVIVEGAMSDLSEFTFDKPEGEFTVYFMAGEGHVIEIKSADIQ